MKIIVIDSHPVTHHGIEHMLQNKHNEELKIEKSYLFSQDFLKETLICKVHIIVVGLHITDINTFEFISYLNVRYPEIKIVLFSCLHSKEVLLKAVKAGANGIVSKSVDKESFIEGLKKILQSEHFVYIGNEPTSMNSHKNSNLTKNKVLTPRELEILDLIKVGIKNKDISGILNISLSTVEFHRKNIYSKYSVNNVAELVAKLYEVIVT